jgi:hypothetical protein
VATVILGPLALTRPWLAGSTATCNDYRTRSFLDALVATEHRDDHGIFTWRSGPARAGPPVAT